MLCLSGFDLYSRWVPLDHGQRLCAKVAHTTGIVCTKRTQSSTFFRWSLRSQFKTFRVAMRLLRITSRDNIRKNSESSSKGKARGGWDFPKTKTRDTDITLCTSFPHRSIQAKYVASTILYWEINNWLKSSTNSSELVSVDQIWMTFAISPFKRHQLQPRPQGFSLKKWVGREKPWGRSCINWAG